MQNESERELKEKLLAIQHEKLERLEGDSLYTYKPFPKQQSFVDSILKEGLPRVFAFCANRAGKCVRLSTIVLCNDSSTKKLSEVSVGDRILSYDLKTGKAAPSNVVGKTYSGIQEVFRVTFSDGGTLECTANHIIPGLQRAGKFIRPGKMKR